MIFIAGLMIITIVFVLFALFVWAIIEYMKGEKMIRKGNYVAYGGCLHDGVGEVLAKDKKRVAVKSMATGQVLILNKDLCMKIPKTVADKLKEQNERA